MRSGTRLTMNMKIRWAANAFPGGRQEQAWLKSPGTTGADTLLLTRKLVNRHLHRI